MDGVGAGDADEGDVAIGEGGLEFAEGVEPEGDLEAAGFLGGGVHPAGVDDEEAEESAGFARGGEEGGVVPDAEVASEPVDGGFGHAAGSTQRRGTR